jgi:hypothetical protein
MSDRTPEIPVIFTTDHFAAWDEAARNLAIADAIIRKCEDCGWPVSEARQECDRMKQMLAALNAQWRNPQTGQPEVRS